MPNSLNEIRQVWRSAFGGRRVTYLGGPITTGMRFIDWYQREAAELEEGSGEYRQRMRAAVVEPNEIDLKMTAELLRARLDELIIEPASVFVENWSQSDYLELWEGFIIDHVRQILFMPGWEYSAGCVAEFSRAHLEGIPTASIDGTPIVTGDGITAIQLALSKIESMERSPQRLLEALRCAFLKLEEVLPRHRPLSTVEIGTPRKDQSLDKLAELINVAQFVSFEPHPEGPRQAYSRVIGELPNAQFLSVQEAAETLLERSAERSVNVRSFTPESPLSREFVYGLTSTDQIVATIERLTNEGLNTIINETVDVNDGGVSGVVLGNVIEFAPDDTPRAVEKPGVASLPIGWGLRLLTSVYGFEPEVVVPRNARLEFSIHPRPRGWRRSHTIGWEIAEADALDLPAAIQWPNRFSRMIGDKVFGLLVAHHIGLQVPRATVINRRVAPFSFGQPTGTNETWFRTAPADQMPGKYTTARGWLDPFMILQSEDPAHANIPSVIAQVGVRPEFSGASIILSNGGIFTEGVQGSGEDFMIGAARSEKLPQSVLNDVEAIHSLSADLGAVRFEWVHDGERAWVVQLHKGATDSEDGVLVQGDATEWIDFDIARGLPALREVLAMLDPGAGILLKGEVGLTSHVADVIRKARIPARMASTESKVA